VATKVAERVKSKPITPKKTKSQVREYSEAILVALLAALLLRSFVVQAFRIPTGSMKDTLLIGDFLLVNKFIYGARTPDSIPFTEIQLPSWRVLPALRQPGRGDIIVFKFPRDPKLDYIKRCIAVAGDVIEIRDGEVWINGRPEGEKAFVKKEYDPEEGHYVNYYQVTSSAKKTYTIRRHVDRYSNNSSRGPMRVPFKGEPLPENLKNSPQLLQIYDVDRDGRYDTDQYFMMGDNRDNSADSREWGFLPARNVVGQAMVIYMSWDKQAPLYRIFNKIRWARIGNLIE
jgi:signal peptidase I